MIVCKRTSAGWSLVAVALTALIGGVALAQAGFTPDTGTVGTRLTINGSGFGAAGGKAILVDTVSGATRPPMTALKVVTWSDSQITADLAKAPKSGLMDYELEVVPKGAPAEIIPGAFTLAPLALTSVDPETGAPGASVTIQGNYFGAKRGRVYLRSPGSKGKACKVSTWTMNPTTGVSTAVVAVPKANSGDYELYVDNGLSNATWTSAFTVTGP